MDRTGAIREYHVHVYCDTDSRQGAAELRALVEKQFAVRISPWSDVPTGPHLTAQYQIAFAQDQFSTLVPFLMMNRMGLTMVVHPQSGRPRDDHTLNAMWMGKILPVNTEFLQEADGS
jgi:DOPA 4,5-dioxygenase